MYEIAEINEANEIMKAGEMKAGAGLIENERESENEAKRNEAKMKRNEWKWEIMYQL